MYLYWEKSGSQASSRMAIYALTVNEFITGRILVVDGDILFQVFYMSGSRYRDHVAARENNQALILEISI